jgi:hypothetical protein
MQHSNNHTKSKAQGKLVRGHSVSEEQMSLVHSQSSHQSDKLKKFLQMEYPERKLSVKPAISF